LWIIAAGTLAVLLSKLKAEPAPSFPAGVYFFGDDVLRVGIIAASELPRDRSTLLVRLMAAGPLLAGAIEDLAALPQDAHERIVAEQILLRLQHVLGTKPRRTQREQEFVVTMQNTWEKARELGEKKGRAEGRAEGRVETEATTKAQAVLTVLEARGITVPEEVRERILAQKDPKRLERWLRRAAVVSSAGEVINTRS
jgi:hypothetical protein